MAHVFCVDVLLEIEGEQVCGPSFTPLAALLLCRDLPTFGGVLRLNYRTPRGALSGQTTLLHRVPRPGCHGSASLNARM